MHIKKILSFLIVVLMVAQPFSVRAIEEQNDFGSKIIESQNSIDFGNTLSTNAVGGEETLKANIIPDSGFTEEDFNGEPEYFSNAGSAYQNANFSYQDNVHSGTYSGHILGKGSSVSYASAYGYAQPTENVKLNKSVILDFWYNAYANPDILSNGMIFLSLYINSASGGLGLQYIFSMNGFYSNNITSQGYYDMRGDLSTWFHFSRNITSDFEDACRPISPEMEIQTLYFYAQSPSNPTGFTEFIIDDVSLTNNTGHEQISNGDFEDGSGTYWYTYRTGPGDVTITYDDYTEGASAMNLTASAYYDQSSAYCRARRYIRVAENYFPKSFQPLQPEDITIDFDWKYSDVENGGATQYSYFRIYAYNDTFNYDLYFYLGYYDDSFAFSNSTTPSVMNRYYQAENFGSRDTWNHFSLDLYDIAEKENITGVPINRIEFYNYAANYHNASTQLLVDNFNFVADPVGDPSFEMDYGWHANDPINSWSSNWDHLYANITSDAHSGNYAANVSSYNSYGSADVYRDMYLPIDDNLYTDFWWKLDHITNEAGDYSFISLQLNTSYYIYYILGESDGVFFTNSSTECFFLAENFNSTGTWYNLIRDVTADTFTAFGRSNWYISTIRFRSRCNTPNGKVITLIDDIYFVRDTTPPEIISVVIQNDPPMYYETTEVEIIADDLLHDISEVTLSYQHESTWHQIVATETATNTFTAEIPQFEYGTTIEFYVEALDTLGFTSTDDNTGSNYSYTVGDNEDPILDIFGPDENETLIGDIIFYIDCFDEGSGITTLSIEVDDVEIHSGSIIEEYTLPTTQYGDGDHTLTFTVEDGAGNSMVVEKEITIDNPEPPKPVVVVLGKLFNWGTLVGAGVIGLGIGIFFLVRFIRLKKAA